MIMSGVRGRRTKPMSKTEREAIRQRMLGNTYGCGRTMKDADRKKHSNRMKKSNPMHDEDVAARAMATKLERHGKDFYQKHWQRIAKEGKNGRHIPTESE